jgi:hypothetical protein
LGGSRCRGDAATDCDAPAWPIHHRGAVRMRLWTRVDQSLMMLRKFQASALAKKRLSHPGESVYYFVLRCGRMPIKPISTIT